MSFFTKIVNFFNGEGFVQDGGPVRTLGPSMFTKGQLNNEVYIPTTLEQLSDQLRFLRSHNSSTSNWAKLIQLTYCLDALRNTVYFEKAFIKNETNELIWNELEEGDYYGCENIQYQINSFIEELKKTVVAYIEKGGNDRDDLFDDETIRLERTQRFMRHHCFDLLLDDSGKLLLFTPFNRFFDNDAPELGVIVIDFKETEELIEVPKKNKPVEKAKPSSTSTVFKQGRDRTASKRFDTSATSDHKFDRTEDGMPIWSSGSGSSFTPSSSSHSSSSSCSTDFSSSSSDSFSGCD